MPLSSAIRTILLSLVLVVLPIRLNAEDSVRAPLADGFGWPVHPREDYYIYRGFFPNKHMGEDWNGRGMGNTDLGDPVYSTANGICVYAEHGGTTWGNLLLVRHAYRETNGQIVFIDSVYAHLQRMNVEVGDRVKRGQQVGTIGTANGIYTAHLHFEIRKNLNIGHRQRSFARDYSNYHSPEDFILAHANLPREFRFVRMPVDTFGESSTSNIVRGESLESSQFRLPLERPDRGRDAEDVDSEVAAVLERYKIGHSAPSNPNPAEEPAPESRTPDRDSTTSRPDPEGNDASDRSRIRDFWDRIRGNRNRS